MDIEEVKKELLNAQIKEMLAINSFDQLLKENVEKAIYSEVFKLSEVNKESYVIPKLILAITLRNFATDLLVLSGDKKMTYGKLKTFLG